MDTETPIIILVFRLYIILGGIHQDRKSNKIICHMY
jgi:hypothetical protein